MPFTSILCYFFFTIQELVLSWTPYAKICQAGSPQDYDQVLCRLMREVRFHCETLLAMLFFMGTTINNGPLISWTLASLLYTLITYSVLDAMSGESLHDRLEHVIAGRLILACLAKVPALSVIATLCALAQTSWNSIFTFVVMCLVVGALLLTLIIRLKCYILFERVWKLLTRISSCSCRENRAPPMTAEEKSGTAPSCPVEEV